MPSLVSHQHKLVFIHVPKTAGSSIAYTLADILQPEGFEQLRGYPNHLSYEELIDIEGTRIREYFKFMVVRNPWELIASNLAWHRQNGNDHITIEKIAGKTFTPAALGLQEMDRVLRFERLQEDFDGLCESIGIERRSLMQLNSSMLQDYKALHSEESRLIVERRFAVSIQMFGYTF